MLRGFTFVIGYALFLAVAWLGLLASIFVRDSLFPWLEWAFGAVLFGLFLLFVRSRGSQLPPASWQVWGILIVGVGSFFSSLLFSGPYRENVIGRLLDEALAPQDSEFLRSVGSNKASAPSLLPPTYFVAGARAKLNAMTVDDFLEGKVAQQGNGLFRVEEVLYGHWDPLPPTIVAEADRQEPPWGNYIRAGRSVHGEPVELTGIVDAPVVESLLYLRGRLVMPVMYPASVTTEHPLGAGRGFENRRGEAATQSVNVLVVPTTDAAVIARWRHAGNVYFGVAACTAVVGLIVSMVMVASQVKHGESV